MINYMINSVCLSLGSNLGQKEKNIYRAVNLLKNKAGEIKKVSSLYNSPPWGFIHNENFLNIVISIETQLSPEELLNTILNIEKIMGRVRNNNGYESRIIDIDILFYNNIVLNTPNLIIPHPHIEKRLFVLVPLAEILPNIIHPVLKKTASNLIINCSDKSIINKYESDIVLI